MSDNQKKALAEAASEAGEIETELTNKNISETFEFLKGEMNYVETDLDSIRAKLGDAIYEQFDAEGRAWATGAYKVVKDYKEGK